MANFTDLPAELKVSVTAQMYPEDCLRFALTSKDHWALCRPLVLKHKALWSKYQTTDGHTVWELVDAIEENYMVANYVQQARIDAERATCWGNIPNGEQLRPRWPATQDVVRWAAAVQRNAILGAPFLSLDHPEKEIQRALATGADGWIVALLLLLLPRLQILWYTQDGEHWWLLNALKYVVWAYQLPNPPPSLPFQHLFRVHIDHYDGARSASWEWVYLFACIPSVQLVYGYISSNDLDGVNQFRTQASVSNVTVLRLASSTIYAEIVDLILSKTTQLKSFTYENGGATVSAAGYNPRKMIASLSRYCGDLLEELILFDEDFTNRVEDEADEDGRVEENEDRQVGNDENEAGSHPIHSLCGLTSLKTLLCSYRDVVKGDAEDSDDEEEDGLEAGFYATSDDGSESKRMLHPKSMFPPSLESLHLLGAVHANLDRDDSTYMMGEVVAAKETCLPNLKQVWSDDGDRFGGWRNRADVEARATALGVELKPLEIDVVVHGVFLGAEFPSISPATPV